MIEEIKCCSDAIKKPFNKQLVIAKNDNEDFENSTKCCICDNVYIDGDAKVRYSCHITRKYSGSPIREWNIKILKIGVIKTF